MIIGIGVDLISVERVQKAMERSGERFKNRVFTAAEQAYCDAMKMKYQHYAARFAAKEAVMKSFGIGWSKGVAWTDIEVINLASGQPTIKLHGKLAEIGEEKKASAIHVTISHQSGYAIATAIAEG